MRIVFRPLVPRLFWVSLSGLVLAACTTTSYPGTSGAVRQAPPQRVAHAHPPADTHMPRLYPQDVLSICNGRRISNAPRATSSGRVLTYNRIVLVNGIVPLVATPAENVCLTSGFGPRGGRTHKGIDIAAVPASRVFSGGTGYVKEVRRANGYGLYVLIDHGDGVYTRYAHLASTEPDIRPGSEVWFGRPLGRMGQSGNATGIHLHYEVLTGDYNNPRQSFGLRAVDPLSLPPWQGQAAGG